MQISWRRLYEIYEIVDLSRNGCNLTQKNLLKELMKYLEG